MTMEVEQPKPVFRFNTDDVTVYYAGPGAGKTTALMREMAELLKRYRPDEIAFVTFTRKGVANGIDKAIAANPGLKRDDLPYFKTLHALCFHACGLKVGQMVRRGHMAEINRKAGTSLHLTTGQCDGDTKDDRLMKLYDLTRNNQKRGFLVRCRTSLDTRRYDYVTRVYESFKKARRLVDFTDCLLLFQRRNEPVPVKVAFIDEAQDLTPLQWEVCRIAFSRCEKIRIAGDTEQAIFEYSGADAGRLAALAERYKVVRLEESHRLSRAVYQFARGVVGLMGVKSEKDFRPAKDVEGFVTAKFNRPMLIGAICKDLRDHAGQELPQGRWYLLFRNNCFIREVVEALRAKAVPYHTALGFCLEHRVLTRIARFYRYRQLGDKAPEAKVRFCEKYKIADINAPFTDSELVPGVERYVYEQYVDTHGIDNLIAWSTRPPFVLLATAYKVKGGEADFVAFFPEAANVVKKSMVTEGADAELRVLYVTCTRARIGLYLVKPEKPGGRYPGLDQLVNAVESFT